jgi:hypothetical protein
MPEIKKTRPKFFAPSLPNTAVVDEEVLENDLPESPDAEPVVESIVEPGPKIISHNQPLRIISPLEETLKESTPEPEPSPEPAKPEPVIKKPTTEKPDPALETITQTTNSGSNFLLVVITIFSLVLAAVGWFMYFSASGKLNFTIPELNNLTNTAPTPEVSSAPAPTTAPVVKPVTLEVLNGSGVAGEAGKVADSLTKLGYQVLATGNADNQKYSKTEVYVNATLSDSVKLFKDLGSFGEATRSGILKDSTASARIIIGKNWTEGN